MMSQRKIIINGNRIAVHAGNILTLQTTDQGCKPEEVSTAERMYELLIEENIGNCYRYVGASTEQYQSGDLYVVQAV